MSKSKLVPRPMSSSSREEEELKRAAKRDAPKAATSVEKVRLYCLARGCNGIYTLGKLFCIMDDDHSGNLDEQEFSSGLKSISEGKIDESESQKLFQEFDRDGSGKVSYDEFLRTMRPPLNDVRKSLVQLAFDKMDKTNDGVITYEDMKGIYNGRKHPDYMSGEKTEKQVLIKFLNTFESEGCSPDVEPSGDGKVTWEEFLNYYSGVSASIDEDPYFDLMMRQCWQL